MNTKNAKKRNIVHFILLLSFCDLSSETLCILRLNLEQILNIWKFFYFLFFFYIWSVYWSVKTWSKQLVSRQFVLCSAGKSVCQTQISQNIERYYQMIHLYYISSRTIVVFMSSSRHFLASFYILYKDACKQLSTHHGKLSPFSMW